MKIPKLKKTIFFLGIISLPLTSCELLDSLDEDSDSSSSSSATGTYTYKFSCPAGSNNSIEIPNRLSDACKRSWEFYARTYGCNDVDNFAEADRRKAACP